MGSDQHLPTHCDDASDGDPLSLQHSHFLPSVWIHQWRHTHSPKGLRPLPRTASLVSRRVLSFQLSILTPRYADSNNQRLRVNQTPRKLGGLRFDLAHSRFCRFHFFPRQTHFQIQTSEALRWSSAQIYCMEPSNPRSD